MQAAFPREIFSAQLFKKRAPLRTGCISSGPGRSGCFLTGCFLHGIRILQNPPELPEGFLFLHMKTEAERPGCPGTREQAYKRKRRPVSSLKVSFRPRRYEKCPSSEPAGILLSDAGISAIPRQNAYTQVSSFRAAACPACGSEDVFCLSAGNRSPSGFLPPWAQKAALPCFSGFIPVFFRQLPKTAS